MDTDVLVVGAGPTGLMLANQHGRRGVRALIIDRHAGPSLETRALGVQARTLEIYSHLGIVERTLWRRARPVAILIIFAVAAVVTPGPDVLSQCLVAIPMVILYEISARVTSLGSVRES